MSEERIKENEDSWREKVIESLDSIREKAIDMEERIDRTSPKGVPDEVKETILKTLQDCNRIIFEAYDAARKLEV